MGSVQYKPVKPPAPTALSQAYGVGSAAIDQNAHDYDKIMGNYDKVFSTATASQNQPAYQPVTATYNRSNDLNDAINRTRDVSNTGGYSASDINNLRERGVSPIRSIYSSANRDVDRQRSLQGGYSANYGALKAKMARDLSEQIAGQTTKVNADIADKVAGNKIHGTDALAGVTSAENSEQNRFALANADSQNTAAQVNASRKNTVNDTMLRATEGMRGLYGTTPALSSLFGNQALSTAQLQNNINQNKTTSGFNTLSMMLRGGH